MHLIELDEAEIWMALNAAENWRGLHVVVSECVEITPCGMEGGCVNSSRPHESLLMSVDS